ncbi:tRNA-dihydrouridine(47) synthase [NAD(P)(+)] [Microdochium trichocladiopsis]|uniref:tRNA-dihydrouridine(47) synthase [NAD(P)(+)] n=1 Tax=Microdochium trichocladiopsis TaxID=1682393 RepID=A0A9P8Y255_9PEZI|nr:tRNA-dihydrouridine(47) synthase [NAD(P)(+)] [Microdochium trichocladiopsis]KAH7027736.1 tRNA-dihydrouridine(47) synthase [NAD(P)(+)] [Microdochium trichocladiopsis]
MSDEMNVDLKRPSEVDGAAGQANGHDDSGTTAPAAKRVKVDNNNDNAENAPKEIDARDDRDRGMAKIKPEFLLASAASKAQVDDDAAEASGAIDHADGKVDARDGGGKKKKKKQGGQNHNRSYGQFDDELRLCNSRTYSNEFSPKPCRYGDRCNMCHDLRKYFSEGRRGDLTTLGGKCPMFAQYQRCPAGWKCRFIKSHSEEVEREDGRKELVLLGAPDADDEEPDRKPGVVNVVHADVKYNLSRRKADLSKSERYTKWVEKETDLMRKIYNRKKPDCDESEDTELHELRAQFVEPPFKASEKRKIYFGRETPTLAPLTTQGNLPFRRLCVELGAQVTYSEMALGMPVVQGGKGEWALMKAHESEISSPRYSPSPDDIVQGYDNSKDIKFGAQITGNQPWVVMKATEALTNHLPHLRVVDLNCGCPIDLVFQQGAGSGLLDAPPKLEKMIRGMNAVSGEVPITAKLRMGVRDGKPNATKLIERLAFGSPDFRERLGAPGCAAVTLHGRSRQQRYTKSANWTYIAECAALIKSYNQQRDELTDTIREADASTQANTTGGKMYFLGNGDCYSHIDYFDHVDNAKVDTVMIARGAMIKPWIFEEIEKGQYLDKSATERLAYVEKFVRYGLEAWGSDELGLGFTRRFLLEWLSFTCRYIPLGILEHLPAKINDRPPAYRGRNDLETLLSSNDYRDWIKISEMFLGPAHPSFNFQPKHKSSSYDTIEAEG